MKTALYSILFLVLNFGALALGAWLMNSGPTSAWYQNLNKAPWTPPGWVFGVAWSLIMLCFSVFMTRLVLLKSSLKIALLFGLQWGLNVSWNFLFFNQHEVVYGLVVLFGLASIITYFMVSCTTTMKNYRFFIVPYFLWLLVAISLNSYVLFYN
ncbi:TspO/MBR family protein [Flavicella sediminum]|uniref:TspO/MBR family protein n=1 Tax=Flavicella sediminum TaxID=2585141 RepID=UPI00111D7E19|nr:TspO/MBR family protein [Flavicella sediminum]